MAKDQGLPLPGEPGDIIPELDEICIQVYLPDEEILIRSFWGHIWQLDRWHTHAHGTVGDTRAAQAAAVWREKLIKAHVRYLEGGRCGVTEPICTCNCGDTIIHCGDSAGNGGAGASADGGMTEQFFQELKDFFNDAVGYAPAKEYYPFMEPDHRACRIAWGASSIAEQARDDLIEEFSGLSTVAGVLGIVAGVFCFFSAGMAAPAAIAFSAAALAAGEAAVATAISDEAIEEFRCMVYNHVATGTLNRATIKAIQSSIDAAWSANHIAWTFFSSLVETVGVDGFGRAPDFYGIPLEPDCSDCHQGSLRMQVSALTPSATVEALGGGQWQLRQYTTGGTCYIASIESWGADDAKPWSIQGMENCPPRPTGCNSNQVGRTWAAFSQTYNQRFDCDAVLNAGDVWRIVFFSTEPISMTITVGQPEM